MKSGGCVEQNRKEEERKREKGEVQGGEREGKQKWEQGELLTSW